MITITLTIALELSSIKTSISTTNNTNTTKNRAELGCYSQSYSDGVDIHVLTELNSGAIVRAIVIVLIYTF
jgi:hypothetical protein